MRLSTTEPVCSFTPARISTTPGQKGGARYPRFAGFAAETQRFPDSPNNPQFPLGAPQPRRDLPSRHALRFHPPA
jgi:aldose 1-epimerase